MNVAANQACLKGWQQRQLYAGGKAAGIGKMLALGNGFAVRLGQAVDVVVRRRSNAEVLRKVDYLHALGNGVLLQERLALAVSEAEEHHINLVERHLAGEFHFGFANQTFVNVVHLIAGVTLRIGKHNFSFGMLQQHPYQFSAGVARGTKYSYFNHILLYKCDEHYRFSSG